jgi:hypothetical protein
MALFWCISIPAAIYGWTRFGTEPRVWTLSLVFSLGSLVLGTFSLLLVFVFYCFHVRGGLIGTLGFFPSLVAVVFALCGIWKRNSLRWSSLICALGVWLYWFLFNAV